MRLARTPFGSSADAVRPTQPCRTRKHFVLGLVACAIATLTLNACMTPGTPAYPCAGTPTTYQTTATVLLKVQLSLGNPTT